MDWLERLSWLLLGVLPGLIGLVICVRRLPLGPRIALVFCLGLYVATLFLGAARLFVLREVAILDYYRHGGYLPTGTSWNELLVLAVLPLVVLPWAALLLQPFFGIAARQMPALPRIDGFSLWLGVALCSALGLAVLAPLIPMLITNAWTEFVQTEGLQDLYQKRRDLFRELRALYPGLIYSALPACAGVLLCEQGRGRKVARAAGLALAGLAILLMLGTFQIVPILAFVLMIAFCFLAFTARRLRVLPFVLFGLVGIGVLQMYSAVKHKGEAESRPLLSFVMRMPIALPYAIDMKDAAPAVVQSTNSMPHELADFMDGKQRSDRFSAMALPGYVIAWMKHDLPGALVSLFAIVGLILIGGNALQRAGVAHEPGRGVALIAVILGPALYYAFQISLVDLFVSSYGLLYLAVGPLAVLGCRFAFALGAQRHTFALRRNE